MIVNVTTHTIHVCELNPKRPIASRVKGKLSEKNITHIHTYIHHIKYTYGENSVFFRRNQINFICKYNIYKDMCVCVMLARMVSSLIQQQQQKTANPASFQLFPSFIKFKLYM